MVLQGRPSKKKDKAIDKPSPTANISKIGSLKRFSDQEYANSLLHQVAKLVAPILHMNNFKVGTLCEMYPKNPNLLGLNVNRGQKILIRLRYHSNDKLFYPLCDIIGTMLHELTHNLYGPHDAKFYKFLDGLKNDFENIQYGTLAKTNYVCEEQSLGGRYNPRGGYISVREKRIAALSAHKFKSESRKLGTSAASDRRNKTKMPSDPAALRKLILEATERRLKDSKWCPTAAIDTKDIEPDKNDLDIVVVDKQEEEVKGEQNENLKFRQTMNMEILSYKKDNEYKEVIDLTNEEYEGKLIREEEIIVIEGCEKQTSQKGKTSIQPTITNDSLPIRAEEIQPESKVNKSTTTSEISTHSLLPPLDDDVQHDFRVIDAQEAEIDEPVQYSSSPSYGRTFIYEGNSDKYPRRKLVADLDFDQIIKKGEKIHVSNPLSVINEDLSLGNINTKVEANKMHQETMHLKNDCSLEDDSENHTQPTNMEYNSKKATNKSNKNTSEQAKMESKKRKGEKKNDSSKDSNKTAKNAKKTAKKAEQRALMKKTVKSIDFEDLFSEH